MPDVQKAGFLKWGRLVVGGDNLGKMEENCMKTTKSEFWGRHSRGEQANLYTVAAELTAGAPVYMSPLLSNDSSKA